MNKAKLKAYAPLARKDFIAAVTARAQQIGLAEKNGSVEIAPAEKSGDFVIIAGQSWPAKISQQRANLIARIEKEGFAQTMEAVAYTWFNRFAALRYMEIHDYLSHGYRALSSREGGLPEILNVATELAQNGDLTGLNAQQAIALKLAGDKDGELYRLTLIAQCNVLAKVMPFLFERIDNETELLLPENLLLTDSVIAKLVEAIPEEDWQEVEIVGWLYQFYISEKKDQVIGKVVKSENIPAATQLFTPNWIVQYLVQNSIGRLWSMANPASLLKSDWPYYIEPAEQTPEAQAQLDALIQSRMAEDGGSLNPETITVIDPACGSGHILVEAYDILKAIYLERGYQLRSIPRVILQKNLYGLDIDDRAAQLAGFALLMKARADDRRLFDELPKLNVYSIQSSKNLNLPLLWRQLDINGQGKLGVTSSLLDELQTDLVQVLGDSNYQLIKNTLALFEQAQTLGSLIQVPSELAEPLKDLLAQLQALSTEGNSFQKIAATTLIPFIRQAVILGMQFDAVVANPPYMGGKGMNPALKEFAKRVFPDSKSDLFAIFMERGFQWCNPSGFSSMVTMQSWMFLSSYEAMREKLLKERTLSCMVHMGNNVMGIAFGTAATIFTSKHINDYAGSFSYCDNDALNENAIPTQFPVQNERLKTAQPDGFKKIPGSPIAYWVSDSVKSLFQRSTPLENLCTPRVGLGTCNNAKFVRSWSEISWADVLIAAEDRLDAKKSEKKWFPYNKGGAFRRWYGNNDYLINWQNDGRDVKKYIEFKNPNVARGESHYFKEGVTWGLITSSAFSCRYMPKGFIFDVGGSSGFPPKDRIEFTLAFLNSNLAQLIFKCLNPTVNTQVGDIQRLPVIDLDQKRDNELKELTKNLVHIYKQDWDLSETSWEFRENPLIEFSNGNNTKQSFAAYLSSNSLILERAYQLEKSVNVLLIATYGLQDELSPEVPEKQITLARADREKDSQRLISYAIGCMMGRYSLDDPGLIYANAGNIGLALCDS